MTWEVENTGSGQHGLNYLAHDRRDIKCVAKETCSGMCFPTRDDVKKSMRLGGYMDGV